MFKNSFKATSKNKLTATITLCLAILMLSSVSVFADEGSNAASTSYTCVAWSSDYGLKAHTYYVSAREYFTVEGEDVVGTHRYLLLSEYPDLSSGSAGLWNTTDTRYDRYTNAATQLLQIYPNDYQGGSFFLEPGRRYYFWHENFSTFRYNMYDYISKSNVSTYYELDSSWAPSLFSHNTEFQITY